MRKQIFLDALEIMQDTKDVGGHDYICLAIHEAHCDSKGIDLWEKEDACEEQKFFEELFRPESEASDGGFWPRLEDGCFDYESRFLALGLCIAILEENQGS